MPSLRLRGLSQRRGASYCPRMRMLFAACTAVLLIASARADQTDKRLDDLFAALAKADKPEIAAPIEQEIWTIWIETDSPTTELLYARGAGMIEAGDLDLAKQLLDTVVLLDPDYAEGWNMRATLHALRDEYPAAIADTQKTLELEPRNFVALAGLGQLLEGMGDDKGALKAYEAALKINPSMEQVKQQAKILRRKIDGDRI